MKQLLIALIVYALSGSAGADRDHRLRKSTAPLPNPESTRLTSSPGPQIDALERQRTLFILPVGMIEQHGPHLPVGADTIAVTYEAARLRSVSAERYQTGTSS